MDVDLTVVSAAESDTNNNKENTSSHSILVELAGRMIDEGRRTEVTEERSIEQVTSFLSQKLDLKKRVLEFSREL